MTTRAENRKIERLTEKVKELAGAEAERTRIKNEDPRTREARLTKQQQIAEIWENLEQLGGKLHNDDDILYEGTKLVLPAAMSITQGIDFLDRKRDEMERETYFSRQFNYRPWDGAWCMWQVMKRQFGAVNHRGRITMGMLGPMEEPPGMISINTGVDEQEQVPWGRFSIPDLDATWFETGAFDSAEYGTLFQLSATGPKKHRFRIEGIFELVEKELAERSLYRGKAFDGQEMPEFVDVHSVDRDKVVYSEDVTTQIEANVWGQLRHTEETSKLGIPLKRAVLVHGPFGTGKTLLLMLTGQEAEKAGWTFIKLRPGRDDLAAGMKTARLYQPAVIAYEDIDVVAGAVAEGERTTISRLLDDFDGIDAKGTKILAILTTNYPERIHKGMARPGRLDAMIELTDLDQPGVEALVKVRIPADKLEEKVDWAAVFEAAEGYKPAFVTEFADRSMRYLLVRSGGSMDGVKIGTDDLVSAAKGLRPQYEKMLDAKDITEREPLSVALDRRVEHVVRGTIRGDLLVPAVDGTLS